MWHLDHVGEAEFARQKGTDGHPEIDIGISNERDALAFTTGSPLQREVIVLTGNYRRLCRDEARSFSLA